MSHENVEAFDVLDTQVEWRPVLQAGRLRTRGKGSGAPAGSPFGWVGDFKNGKSIRIRTYLDPNEALELIEPKE